MTNKESLAELISDYRGISNFNEGKFEEALEAFNDALLFNCKDIVILFNKGETLVKRVLQLDAEDKTKR